EARRGAAESVTMFAAEESVGSPSLEVFQNPTNPFDVNDDGDVSPMDAMLVLNETRRLQTREAAEAMAWNGMFYDVSGDQILTPLDALYVLNALARGPGTEVPQPFSSDWVGIASAVAESEGTSLVVTPAVASAGLVRDTAPDGTTNHDGVTSDPTI